MAALALAILAVVIVLAVMMYRDKRERQDDDSPEETFGACPSYGCPSKLGDPTSVPPRGNVVLNEFYFPYSGAPYFEHNSDDVTMEPDGPAFISGDPATSGGVEAMSATREYHVRGGLKGFSGQTLSTKAEPDHIPPS